ncbi:hypothetical protein KEM48_014072 [Puccinia striiformis f. sp. tritici PST-130]|nr:hypothetical protein KEM48_014072 [Puccinia striiformis f. sp. tritici PST-130]
MHFITSIVVFLAACGLAVGFRCPNYKPLGFCGYIQSKELGGDGNWRISIIQPEGRPDYPNCGTAHICGNQAFYDLVYKMLGKASGIRQDAFFTRNSELAG